MTIPRAAHLFALLADPTRLSILQLISVRGGASVGAMVEQLDVSQSAVSHQLHALVQARVAVSHKEGRTVTYTLAPNGVGRQVGKLLRSVL